MNTKGYFSSTAIKKKVEFRSGSKVITLESIRSVSLGRQKFNWMIYLKIDSFFLMFCFLSKGSLLYYLFGLGVGNLIGVVFGWYLVPWIVVEFLEEGLTQRAFFMDSSYRGYGGAFGGTKKMFRHLKELET